MGKWAKWHFRPSKFAQIAQKRAKKAQKVPFSENASKFFCPLLVFKNGQKPTFFGHFSEISSVPFFKTHIKPGKAHFQKFKNGREITGFKDSPHAFFNAKRDQFSCQSILPDPRSRSPQVHIDRISYVAAYEIFHLLC